MKFGEGNKCKCWYRLIFWCLHLFTMFKQTCMCMELNLWCLCYSAPSQHNICKKMTIQKFIVWMMGQPCVKDFKKHWWILHGAICYVVQLRNISLALYTITLHIHNSFWFFQIIRFCKTNSCCTHKKIGKNKSLTPHVHHMSCFNFIMFEEIDKLRS